MNAAIISPEKEDVNVGHFVDNSFYKLTFLGFTKGLLCRYGRKGVAELHKDGGQKRNFLGRAALRENGCQPGDGSRQLIWAHNITSLHSIP